MPDPDPDPIPVPDDLEALRRQVAKNARDIGRLRAALLDWAQ